MPALAHGLGPPPSKHPDGGLRAPCDQSRDRRCARPCPRRLCFSNSALEEAGFHIMLSIDDNHFNIHTILELRTALNLGRLVLPVLRKLPHEDYIVRIPH